MVLKLTTRSNLEALNFIHKILWPDLTLDNFLELFSNSFGTDAGLSLLENFLKEEKKNLLENYMNAANIHAVNLPEYVLVSPLCKLPGQVENMQKTLD